MIHGSMPSCLLLFPKQKFFNMTGLLALCKTPDLEDHPDEEALEVDWPCHPPRNLHHQDHPALGGRGKVKEGPSCGGRWGEGNEADWEDLEQQLSHSSHGEGLADVEGSRCCPTHHPL